jgi:MFS family permease
MIAFTIVINLIVFAVGMALGEAALFLGNGPISMSVMSSVPAHVRSQAIATAFFMLHLFGDLISPIIIGELIDTIGMHWALMFLIAWLVWAALFWFAGYIYARKYFKYVDE